MDIFALRNQLTQDYATYASSFIQIHDERIRKEVIHSLEAGTYWPHPLIQLNPSFEAGGTVDDLVSDGLLHPECRRIFVKDSDNGRQTLRFHRHQRDAIKTARDGHHYILTTGTGSGKSLAYIVPIVDHVLRRGSGKGIQAIIVYPMNALANSQANELKKFLEKDYPKGQSPVTFARYTGQEDDKERQGILQNPPDILLTNYVMLELIMTRPKEKQLIERASGLRFIVLDELHTYRGRQGADVALLMRRVRNRLETSEHNILFVGTSATLASQGSYAEQRAQIAAVGTQIFGVTVKPENVIGETLRRATPEKKSGNVAELSQAASKGKNVQAPEDYQAFVNHPFSAWIEDTFGLQEKEGRLARQEPKSIHEAAAQLSQLIDVPKETCAESIERWLLAGYNCKSDPNTGRAPFAFRLHQFISPADTVYATIEREAERYLTLHRQHYVPGDRDKVLFPLCFCRECGQEYYTVRLTRESKTDVGDVTPRDFNDYLSDDTSEAGYIYIGSHNPWGEDHADIIQDNRLPDDWLENHKGSLRIRATRRDKMPRHMRVMPSGEQQADGLECVYVSSPFMFCLNCGVSYSARQGDFGKLATLSSEGRSSATTLLSLSAIRSLKKSDLPSEAQKLLSFTDNRQDASLQAGHFNDFIEVSLLRAAIYRAVKEGGEEGLTHDIVAQKVFDALGLPFEDYASDPSVAEGFSAYDKTQQALRMVLGYRIYRDLRRGWRIALPNLEQCGLLEIKYTDLDAICAAQDIWQDKHPALETALPQTRQQVAKTLLDYMRRELAIKVDYLDRQYQERIQQVSSQHLQAPWAIDEDETMEYASTLMPRASSADRQGGFTYVSARGGFGMYLRRPNTFPNYLNHQQSRDKISLEDTERIIVDLLKGLRVAGLVEVTYPSKRVDEVDGYQLVASAMRWCAGSGERSFHDPIRTPNPPQDGGKPNPFFVDFYRQVAQSLVGLLAREHTAQVPYEEREARENLFRSADLPILYCSPTMELGVDIAELNVVNMRNVPPTPANYAQRSGRAGRSGQPALVFTYCSSGSPHDQYFFRRPERMVAGAVAPPRLELNNEDLIRAHIHAIWLAETGIDLKETLKEILDMSGNLELLPEIRQQAESTVALSSARQRARSVLASIPNLNNLNELLDDTMQKVVSTFDSTCERWRNLYRSALKQVKVQESISHDPLRSSSDKKQAERLRREALSQINLLTETKSLAQSDFYSYRYFATEGFLPGYSFPRLPLSAFIPARRSSQRDNFLSRPRFLAISEFGPRAIIYHEGSRYLINQVIMPVTEDEEGPLTTQIKQCANCGYIHHIKFEEDYDLCQRCGYKLDRSLQPLLRLQNVVTRRRDRISADEENRLRLGYEIRTGLRFRQKAGEPDVSTAMVKHGDDALVKLSYAQAATLWRINLGWTRRENKQQYGFVLDIERGYWARNEQNEEDPDDPLSERTRRVIPYVEDSRNCLLFEPLGGLDDKQMASLQAALKRAIEATYQLEDNELAAEPLPDSKNRRSILFYEATEGGAGVLRRLVEEPDALGLLAQEALRICHFDPDTGADLRRAPKTHEDCEAACYDCLLSYGNQREHSILDRHSIREHLLSLTHATLDISPSKLTRDEHLKQLLSLCESDLERKWLEMVYRLGLRLPDKAQAYIENCQTRADFVYDSGTVIYIDGSYHDAPHRQARDQQQTDCLEDYGYRVLRFGYRDDDWKSLFDKNKHTFGGEA